MCVGLLSFLLIKIIPEPYTHSYSLVYVQCGLLSDLSIRLVMCRLSGTRASVFARAEATQPFILLKQKVYAVWLLSEPKFPNSQSLTTGLCCHLTDFL